MEKTVEKARSMILDLQAAGITLDKIASGASVSPMTLSNVKKGQQRQISERVYDSIWDFWSENSPAKTGEAVQPVTDSAAINAAEKGEGRPKLRQRRIAKKTAMHPAAVQTSIAPFDATGLINRDYAPVNIAALTEMLDGMLKRFRAQVNDMELIKSMLPIK